MNIQHHAMRYKLPHSPTEGVCGVSIFHPDADMAVVVLTDVESNTSLSVTNAVEHIANRAKRTFITVIDPDQIIWIERYGIGSRLDLQEQKETFDLVMFTRNEQGYAHPSWRSLGNRDAASFWNILFQSNKPLCEFPDFALAGNAMR